jgi:putative membrane protein
VVDSSELADVLAAYESADEVPEDVVDAAVVDTPVLPEVVVLVDVEEVATGAAVVATGAAVVATGAAVVATGAAVVATGAAVVATGAAVVATGAAVVAAGVAAGAVVSGAVVVSV